MTDGSPQALFSRCEYNELAHQLSLSPKELQIVRQVLAGLSDKQIAQKLHMALPTLRTHVQRLFLKLDVHDKTNLVLHLFRRFRQGCLGDGCPRRCHQER